MRRTLLAISAAAALLAGACGSADHHATSAGSVGSTTSAPPTTSLSTTTTSPPRTTTAPTTTVPNTSIVPGKITVRYVDAVLAKLNHVYGDAVRSTVAAKKLTPGAIRDLDAIYSKDLATEERSIFQSAAKDGFGGIRKDPGDRQARVVRIISASDSCVFTTVKTSYAAVDVRTTKSPAVEWIGIRRRSADGVSGLNPTPWIFFFDGISATATTIKDQCGASS